MKPSARHVLATLSRVEKQVTMARKELAALTARPAIDGRAREARALAMRESGLTYPEIGRRLQVTPGRANQIVRQARWHKTIGMEHSERFGYAEREEAADRVRVRARREGRP